MNSILIQAAEGVHSGGVELPFAAVIFGIIAMGVFLLLGAITWSYRDVANRSDHKTSGSQSH